MTDKELDQKIQIEIITLNKLSLSRNNFKGFVENNLN